MHTVRKEMKFSVSCTVRSSKSKKKKKKKMASNVLKETLH